jgi:putative glycosyltransferase (TIGR04372 family)
MKFLRLLVVPFALLFVIAIRLMWPWKKVRMGNFISDRIGHLVGNTEIYLCERAAGEHQSLDLWTHHGEICNKQADRMIARVLHLDRTGFIRICMVLNKLFKGGEHHYIFRDTMDRDAKNIQERFPPQLSFTDAELEYGHGALKRMGIPSGAKFVCLVVRDAAYLPHLSYHEFRDTDIDTYTDAILALAERGYYVLRMGAKVAKPLKFRHPLVIDYASGPRTDFLDMYLMAHCNFCVSTGTGLDAVAVAFRRPVCYVNYVPIQYMQTYHRGLSIWKHYERDGKRLTLSEIYESGAADAPFSKVFSDKGITLVDNTPQEIKEAVCEMADGIASDSQEWFWKDFPRGLSQFNNLPLHGEIRMRIGSEFLKAYR